MNTAQIGVFVVPVLIYAALRHWRQGESWRLVTDKLGLTAGNRSGYAIAGALAVLLIGATWLILHALPASVLHDPRVTASQGAALHISALTVALVLAQQLLLVAVWEELFFRGFLGGWLVRKLGFRRGNAIQATLFVIPHLLLLLVSLAFWPLLILQWGFGWINGWLRTTTGSIGPGVLVHTVANAAAIVLAAL